MGIALLLSASYLQYVYCVSNSSSVFFFLIMDSRNYSRLFLRFWVLLSSVSRMSLLHVSCNSKQRLASVQPPTGKEWSVYTSFPLLLSPSLFHLRTSFFYPFFSLCCCRFILWLMSSLLAFSVSLCRTTFLSLRITSLSLRKLCRI